MTVALSLNSGTASTDTSQTPALTFRDLSKLDLNEDQRTKIRAILNTARQDGTSLADVTASISNVLTDAQKTQLASLQQAQSTEQQSQSTDASPPNAPPPSNDVFASLNLSSDQKTKISAIFQNASRSSDSQSTVKQQIDAVLTPAQQQLAAEKGTPSSSSDQSSSNALNSQNIANQLAFARATLTKFLESQVNTASTPSA